MDCGHVKRSHSYFIFAPDIVVSGAQGTRLILLSDAKDSSEQGNNVETSPREQILSFSEMQREKQAKEAAPSAWRG